MAVSLSSPVTGAPVTGFTTPTYTVAADQAPDASNGKQWYVSALGGTQTGATVHSVASPFTGTMTRPKVFRNLGKANPVTAVIADVPRNVYGFLTRKGMTPLAGQPYVVGLNRTYFEVPAGVDTADAPNLKAGVSFHIGCLWQQSSGIADSLLTGVL